MKLYIKRADGPGDFEGVIDKGPAADKDIIISKLQLCINNTKHCKVKKTTKLSQPI